MYKGIAFLRRERAGTTPSRSRLLRLYSPCKLSAEVALFSRHPDLPRPSSLELSGRHAAVGGLVLLPLGIALWAFGVIGTGSSLAVTSLGAAMIIGGIAARHLGRRALELVLEREDRCLCLVCHFPLPRVADRGECPECGRSYSLEAVRHLWENWLNPPKCPPDHTWQ